MGAKPFATRRRSRSFVPLLRQTDRRPKFSFTQPSTLCGPMPERMLAPRSGTRADSCETSIPKVESAMTTDAGPQLLSDCQTCFMSSNVAAAGAAFGWGAGAAAGATSTAGALTATGTESAVPASGAGKAMLCTDRDEDTKGAAATATPLAASTQPTPRARRAAGRP